MNTPSQDIIASHKAAASRASIWLQENHGLTLKPTEALELVAQVLGSSNWQTLHGQAKQGQGPRLAAKEAPAPPTATEMELFEAGFATGHAPTDKRNFIKRDGQYVQPRMQALYEGFTKGRVSSTPAPTSPSGGAAQQRPALPAGSRFAGAVVVPPILESAPIASRLRHTLKAGDEVEVENGRAEVLYRGMVLDTEGNKVRVRLPAASDRPFIFDLGRSEIEYQDGIIFAAW